jgi:cytochrome c553
MSGLERMGEPLRAGLVAAALLGSAAAWSADASVAAGKQIATSGTQSGVPACSSCHGARGEGAGAFPRLAGTGKAYLLEQLDDFASGKRQNPIMQPFAQKLAPAERAAVASYFASLPAPLKAIDKEPATPGDAGAWLATRGRWRDEIPACAQCHGPGGSGVGPNFPPLAGLPAEYVTAQLKAWRAGSRAPGPLGLMQGVAKKLTDADVTAVSTYYAGLAAPAKAAPSGAKEQQR